MPTQAPTGRPSEEPTATPSSAPSLEGIVDLRDGGFVRVTDNTALLNEQYIGAGAKKGVYGFPGETAKFTCSDDECPFDSTSINNSCTYDSGINADLTSLGFVGRTARSSEFSNACCDANTCLGGAIWTKVLTIKDNGSNPDRAIFFEYGAALIDDWFEVIVALYEAPADLNRFDEPDIGDLDFNRIVGVPVVDRGSALSKRRQTFLDSGGSTAFFPPGNYFIGFYIASYDATNGRVLGASIEVGDFGVVVPE